MNAPSCSRCKAPINPKNRSGLCRPCNARARSSNPETREKVRAAWAAKLADPAYRSRHFARMAAGLRRKLEADPAFRESRREVGRRVGLSKASILAHPAGSPARKLAGRRVTEARLGWCPPQYRKEYTALARKRGSNAAAARALIEARMRAEMTPFERAMDRIRQGAGIVEAAPIRRIEPAFTLGGVTGEIC